MTIEIGDGPFVFCAAHAGLHDGQFERLHGHTFTVTLRLHGSLGAAGMLTTSRRSRKPSPRRSLRCAAAP